jgi:hypothetical protein
MPVTFRALLLACTTAMLPGAATAQVAPGAPASGSFLVSASAGGTFYCISTRCGSGTLVAAAAGYELVNGVSVEAAVRRHYCFDCDSFTIGDVSVQLRRPGRAVSPFLAAGVGVSADPGAFFMETTFGPHAGLGVWVEPRSGWVARLEGRVRRLGRGEGMGEAGIVVGRRLGTPR